MRYAKNLIVVLAPVCLETEKSANYPQNIVTRPDGQYTLFLKIYLSGNIREGIFLHFSNQFIRTIVLQRNASFYLQCTIFQRGAPFGLSGAPNIS